MVIGAAPRRLVGRDLELGALREWLAACRAGRGRATLIEGEPGIGKSVLIREACDAAAAAGLTVLSGAGDELGQALPLLPFLGALGVGEADQEAAQDERHANVLRLLRGELAFRGVDAVSAAAEQLFALVEEAAGRGPTLLAVDDLQWADPATVALWSRLVRSTDRLPLLLVGAVRPASPGDPVRALRRAVDAANLLRPGPLAEPAVSTLLTALTGARPGPRLIRLAADAAGNPLYLTELIGVLERGARLAKSAPGTIDITAGPAPATLSAAIADRLDFLADEVRTALRAAALLGVHFAVEDLAAVQRRSVADLLPVLDEAVTAGVLADSEHGLGFRHPLIRAALYEELIPPVRRAYHREAARALAAAGAPVDRVARQLLPAAELAGGAVAADGQTDSWMLDWLVEAGPALMAQTPTIAVDLLRPAVASASRRRESIYGALARHLADALNRLGNTAEAERVALAALARVADPAISTELHWTLSEVRLNTGREAADQPDLDQALAAPGLAARDRARLLTMKARLLLAASSIDRCAELADQALAEATAAGDNRDVAWALHIKIVVLVQRGRAPETPPLFDRALAAVADEPHLADLRLLLGINRAVGLGGMDRLDEAIEQAREVCAAAARSGSVIRLAGAHSALGEVLFDVGRWDRSLESLRAVHDDVKNVADICTDHGVAALIRLHRGEAAEAARHLAAATGARELVGGRVVASFTRARALLAEHEGRPAEALAILAPGISAEYELDEVEDFLPDALRLARDTGDAEVGARALALAELLWSRADLPRCAGTVHYGTGLRDGDPALLRRAADSFRTARRPLLEATAWAAAAEASAERADARAAFTEAADIYGTLGAAWDLARLQSRMWARGIRRGPRARHRTARHGWPSLTPTENRVVDLVVRGLSNPQIAEELFLSPRTVGVHVSHVLTKLGLASRTELVREAARRPDLDY